MVRKPTQQFDPLFHKLSHTYPHHTKKAKTSPLYNFPLFQGITTHTKGQDTV